MIIIIIVVVVFVRVAVCVCTSRLSEFFPPKADPLFWLISTRRAEHS